MKLQPIDRVAIAVLVGQIGLGAYIYAFGKLGPLPTHFGLDGRPDGWGDRSQVAGLILAITLGDALIYGLTPALARGRAAEAGAAGMAYARATLLAVGVCVTLLLAAIGVGARTSGSPADVQRLMMVFVGSVMVAGGAFMGKVGPNPFVGVRTFWALRSRRAWDRSNRLLGRLWLWFGLAALFAAPLAPQPAGNIAALAALGLTSVAAVFESWRVWRSDPDRAGA